MHSLFVFYVEGLNILFILYLYPAEEHNFFQKMIVWAWYPISIQRNGKPGINSVFRGPQAYDAPLCSQLYNIQTCMMIDNIDLGKH